MSERPTTMEAIPRLPRSAHSRPPKCCDLTDRISSARSWTFSCSLKAIWVWDCSSCSSELYIVFNFRERVRRRLALGNQKGPVWLLEPFLFLNSFLISAFISQAGLSDLSLLPKLYKERYIVMFILNAVACVDIPADLLVVVCLKWQKARDQEKKTGDMAKEVENCDQEFIA
ncbi:hypothetical protein M422DRAFT_243668 [Sphaerobolus stellatus SS14]|nr:hypothetical protein M422DRAFT_243668 [Sphaerobolus stellatus SS14]